MPEAQIRPSILAADLLKLRELAQAAERGGAARFQVDVMDGMFVPREAAFLDVLHESRDPDIAEKVATMGPFGPKKSDKVPDPKRQEKD